MNDVERNVLKILATMLLVTGIMVAINFAVSMAILCVVIKECLR